MNIIKVANNQTDMDIACRKKVKLILDFVFFKKTIVPRKKTKIELTKGMISIMFIFIFNLNLN